MTPSDADGTASLFLTADAASMESHLADLQTAHQRSRASKIRGGAAMKGDALEVPTVSVAGLSKKCGLPSRYGVLSVDAEGAGDDVVMNFLNSGSQPEYIGETNDRGGGRNEATMAASLGEPRTVDLLTLTTAPVICCSLILRSVRAHAHEGGGSDSGQDREGRLQVRWPRGLERRHGEGEEVRRGGGGGRRREVLRRAKQDVQGKRRLREKDLRTFFQKNMKRAPQSRRDFE